MLLRVAVPMWGEEVYENSVLPAQFCCESEATLKSFKGEKKNFIRFNVVPGPVVGVYVS